MNDALQLPELPKALLRDVEDRRDFLQYCAGRPDKTTSSKAYGDGEGDYKRILSEEDELMVCNLRQSQ